MPLGFISRSSNGVEPRNPALGFLRWTEVRLVFCAWFISMRWLLIALLVSLTALLIAAAGVAHHIWAQRKRGRSRPSAGTDASPGTAEETEVETEL